MSEQEQTNRVISNKRCPVCDAGELTKPFEETEAVCEDCGIVIYDWNEQSFAEESNSRDRTEDSQEDSWSEARPAHNSTQHRFGNAIEVIENVATELCIPDKIRISAAELYVNAAVDSITDGRSVATVAAGAIYTASKMGGEPRPLKRIADIAAIEQSELNRTVRCLSRELLEDEDQENTVTTPEDYLDFLCADLHRDADIPDRATHLIENLREQLIFDGKHPAGIAAAAVYITDTDPPSQRELAATAGISTETLRKRLKELRAAGEQNNV